MWTCGYCGGPKENGRGRYCSDLCRKSYQRLNLKRRKEHDAALVARPDGLMRPRTPRDRRYKQEVTTLYRFYDADDRLLYVGVSGSFTTRWDQHAESQQWWLDVVRADAKHYPTRALAESAERTAIVCDKPLHNVTHNRQNRDAHTSDALSSSREVGITV